MSEYNHLSREQLIKELDHLRTRFETAAASHLTTVQSLQHHQVELETQNSELLEARAQIEGSRIRYVNLYDFAPVGYATLSLTGCILEINLTGARLLNTERSAITGNLFAQYVVKSDLPVLLNHLHQCRNSTVPVTTEISVKGPDGGAITVELLSRQNETEEGHPTILTVLTDIADRKRLEAHRLTISKLESLGVLAGGIAHDFNNLLTIITGNVNLAKLQSTNPKVIEKLDRIEQAGVRAQGLARQLVTFARGGEPVRKVTALAGIIQETATLALSGSAMELTCTIPEATWRVDIDAGQFGQALHNILINAREACPENGKISIQAENIFISSLSGLPLTMGNYVKLSIQDTGEGIPSDILGKIYDPYFTTKETGSGLGLAVANSVVTRHGGWLAVTTKENLGTTFTIYLPAAKDVTPSEHHPPSIAGGAQPSATPARILVMDDESMILNICQEILESNGYRVEVATNGTEAIDLFQAAKASGYPFDLVVLDLTIVGGMGGRETMEHLLKLDKDVRAIVCSGYSNTQVLSRYADFGFRDFLSKPFQMDDLLHMCKKYSRR
ncbi:MAG: response regulator [Acidobacteria bacterium]|nr:response regulator [Acidobacteriota bacterium]